LPIATTSFAFQNGVLSPGETYEFRVILDDFAGERIENRSNTFSPLFTTAVAAVPEPETWVLMLGGLAVFTARRRVFAKTR
jgi:hypothetical protein